LAASVAIFSKMSLMNEFLRPAWRVARQPQAQGGAQLRKSGGKSTHMMDMALEEMPVSGCTCFSTL